MSILSVLKKIIPEPVLGVIRKPYHYFLAFLTAVFYDFPSRKLFVIGVTGTNGKSTVVELLHSILTEADIKTGSVSSIRFKVVKNETRNELKMTMPGRFALQKFLKECVRSDCKYAILEVTSEGIKQYRARFIKFDAAILTNVTPEHIESHGGFENYLMAKLKLFKQVSKFPRLSLSSSRISLGTIIVNGDDPNCKKFNDLPAKLKVTYSTAFINFESAQGSEKKEIKERIVNDDGISFRIGQTTYSSKLIGEFNLYNLIAAVSTGLALKINEEAIKRGIAKISVVPGRLEFVQKKPFAVVVDYAHTPDALRKVYETLREPVTDNQLSSKRKLICVLGAAGGGRDKWKRPEMGKIAAEHCDEIILTNEDPYDENPAKILEDVEGGFINLFGLKFSVHRKIIDRREAVREALKSARPGDTVIITGKGSELFIMGPNNTKIPWDDRVVMKEELRNKQKK